MCRQKANLIYELRQLKGTFRYRIVEDSNKYVFVIESLALVYFDERSESFVIFKCNKTEQIRTYKAASDWMGNNEFETMVRYQSVARELLNLAHRLLDDVVEFNADDLLEAS